MSCGTDRRNYGLRRCTIPTPPQPLPREGLLSRALRTPSRTRRQAADTRVERRACIRNRVSCGTECRNGENLGAPGSIHALPVCLAVPIAATTACAVVQFRPHPNPSRGRGFCRAPCALRVEPAGKRRIPEWSVERAYVTRVSCGTECRNGENLGAPGSIHALPEYLAAPIAATTAYAVIQS